MACRIKYNGKEYSYEDFATMLHDGHLDELVKSGTIDDTGFVPPVKATTEPTTQNKPTRTLAIAQRIFASNANESIKRGVKEKGSEYVPKKLDITDREAQDLVDLYGQEKSETLVRDTKNDLTGDTRTALSAKLYESYKDQADQTTDPKQKQQLYNKAVDVALFAADFAKEAGRAANAAKIWKAVTSTEDMTVMAMEKEQQRAAQQVLAPIQPQLAKTREQFEAEVRKRVTAEVGERMKKAKLITKEQRQKISDAFDSIKIKEDKSQLNDITNVVTTKVINGAIEAVKQAVLTGADVANAIQAGIDYIRENYKGNAQYDPNEFDGMVRPAVEQMIPKQPVKAEDIDESKIKTPKLSGSKKKQFIEKLVDAWNKNELTDDKFEQLYAEQLGVKPFSEEDRTKIRELAKVIAEAEKFSAEAEENFNDETVKKYKDLIKKAQKANQELQAFARKPKDVWDTLITIMQGNLLTPISLVTNIYSNVILQNMRFFSTGIGSLVDYSISKIAKIANFGEEYQKRTIDIGALQKGYFRGGWNGTAEGIAQLRSGQMADERALRELQTDFNPARAVARWADKDRQLSQKVNDAVEGTIGWPAEIMFRLLNLGDKPFRRAAEFARAMEIGTQKGLKGKELEKFLMFPDEQSAAEIEKAGQEATFQQKPGSIKVRGIDISIDTLLNALVNTAGKAPIIGGPLKIILKSQFPFVKTPWNIMVETLHYAIPPVTFLTGAYQIAKGNKHAGSIMIGKAITGAILQAVALELFRHGLMTWGDDDERYKDKAREKKQLQYDVNPPKSINISAIQRGMLTGDFSIQDGDTWINYSKMGVPGVLFDVHTHMFYKQKEETGQEPTLANDYLVNMFTSAPRLLSSSLEQSFLQGTNTLLNAIQDGGGYETQQWLINTSSAISSIAIPNTFATLSKSAQDEIKDKWSDDFWERMKNTYKEKLFMGNDLPAKVNLWGEKITGNPEGRNRYMYYLFDVTKFKNVDTENFKYKLYQEWVNDAYNGDWLPAIPSRSVSYRGERLKLNPREYQELSELVGQERAHLTSTYFNSAGYRYHNKEKRIEHLKELYSDGLKRGKERFVRNNSWNVKTKQQLEEMAKKQ